MTEGPSSRAAALRGVTDLLAVIDELGPDATGELAVRVDEQPRGAVFIESGRVCWAAARGLARRLTELLGARSSLAPGQMESFFVACRADNVPLGEHLVSRGVLRPTDLNEALLLHTVESVRRLCEAKAHATWWARSGKGYSPRFTFTTAELLVRIGASSYGSDADRFAPALEEAFGDGDWGVAFVRSKTSATPEPVALRGTGPSSATALLRLGKWAASVTDAATSFAGMGALVCGTRSSSEGPRSVVAFGHDGGVVVGETGVHGPARILNRRAQERRTGGAHHGHI